VIFCTKLSEGTPETVSISPASIIKAALRADAARVILAHNHPHGFCNPSNADLQTTAYLHKELLRVDVRLQDHIIVASDGICSMWEQGMMPDSRGYAWK
jgi:DNA repair protein RadC